MVEKKDGPQQGIWSLMSGAGTVVIKDGLVSVIMIERARSPQTKTLTYKSTVYGASAIALVKGQDDKWGIIGPVGRIETADLRRLAEGFRILADERGQARKS